MSEAEITAIHSQFIANNPDGRLDRNEFKRLYNQFRTELYQDVDAITQLAFEEFDKDNNGTIGFDEFLVSLIGLKMFITLF